MKKELGVWPCLKWVNPLKKRYYQAVLQKDLLGDLIVTQTWGGIGTRRGGHQHHYCEGPEQAQQYLIQLAKRRKQHGYFLENNDKGHM